MSNQKEEETITYIMAECAHITAGKCLEKQNQNLKITCS